MQPPFDDEINWDQLVARAIMGPEFQAAWEEFNAGQLNQATFECQLLGAFFAAVSSYMVMGTMLGIAVVARRLGLHAEEVLEEAKPLVN